jgi:hypothetical protein
MIMVAKSKIKRTLLPIAMVFHFSGLARADDLPSCFTSPVRADTSWQNWFADNKCGGAITVRWIQVGQDGRRNKGLGFAEACTRTQILQTFVNDKISGFTFEWNDAEIRKSCSPAGKKNSNSSSGSAGSQSAPPSGGASTGSPTDLSALIKDQQEKSSNAEAVNRANESAVVDLAEQRRQLDLEIQQNKMRQERIRQEQQDEAASAIVGGFIQGLGSASSPGSTYAPPPQVSRSNNNHSAPAEQYSDPNPCVTWRGTVCIAHKNDPPGSASGR